MCFFLVVEEMASLSYFVFLRDFGCGVSWRNSKWQSFTQLLRLRVKVFKKPQTFFLPFSGGRCLPEPRSLRQDDAGGGRLLPRPGAVALVPEVLPGGQEQDSQDVAGEPEAAAHRGGRAQEVCRKKTV